MHSGWLQEKEIFHIITGENLVITVVYYQTNNLLAFTAIATSHWMFHVYMMGCLTYIRWDSRTYDGIRVYMMGVTISIAPCKTIM